MPLYLNVMSRIRDIVVDSMKMYCRSKMPSIALLRRGAEFFKRPLSYVLLKIKLLFGAFPGRPTNFLRRKYFLAKAVRGDITIYSANQSNHFWCTF